MLIKNVREHSRLMILSILLIAVTIAAVLLFLAPFVIWQIQPYRPMSIWVVDKTVPYPDYREHQGLFWVLKNEKIAKPGSRKLYDEKSDYFGFYPYGKNEWRESPLPPSGPRPDLIYLADTYGVYKDDYMQRRLSGEISPKIYGGLNANDNEVIKRNLGANNTFIAEFNTAASPTNAFDRRNLGRLLGVKWSGWIGKYFENLTRGQEVPRWVVANWEEQNKQEWNYYGRGFVLISDSDEVQIFTMEDDVGPKGLKFKYRDEWAELLKSRKEISYRYWFEWVQPDLSIETVADYHFDVTARGKERLEKMGLSAVFPAVVRYKNPQYTGWYFAGDFADLNFAKTSHSVWGMQWIKKLLVDDSVDSNVYFYWNAYVPLMHKILADIQAAKIARLSMAEENKEPEVTVRAFGKGFQVLGKDGAWHDLFIRGVNMGLAEPGKFFTEFPEDMATYLRWFDQIADMNANSIRIYTLPPPEMYKALYAHNTQKPDKALFFFQEIWPEEHPPNEDYLAREYRESFLKEIDYGIDAVYGRANVPERKGRAFGIYTADVSPWLLGWLVGRELESSEVMATDARNKGVSYQGTYIYSGKNATPTEVWLAESLDEVAAIEANRYGKLHSVAIVSWPTLDPISHDSEWDPVTGKKNKGNDRASVSIDHFEITPAMKAGLFGAYHIYPNYPDFINNELSYGLYKDEQGVLRYGGYLREFMQGHKRYPALVAEFGMANGFGIAHFAPDGLHHGGHTEEEAGRDILRMLAAIKREGYAGGLIFEWMDEWVKKTWTTEYLMIPYDRHVFWHNAMDPEQNYGLLANDVVPKEKPEMVLPGQGKISSISIAADASYLNLEIQLAKALDFKSEELIIGLDTLGRQLGQMRWPAGNLQTKSGMEFVVRLSAQDKADLLVIPSYNSAESRFATIRLWDGSYERINMLVNGKVTTKDGREIPEKRFDASALRKGIFDESGNLWYTEGNKIFIRLPWTLINVTDPSSLKVLQDNRTTFFNPERDALKVQTTDGFVFDAIVWDKGKGSTTGSLSSNVDKPYVWEGWESTPPYRERLKKSYTIIQKDWANYLHELSALR